MTQRTWHKGQPPINSIESNRAELLAEEIECLHLCLDDAGVPRNDGVDAYSLWGRVQQYVAAQMPPKLWLWKNFVDGRPEYWAFDNAFPIHLDSSDPQTLGEPCGYALFKPSRSGRADIDDAEVLRRIKQSTNTRL